MSASLHNPNPWLVRVRPNPQATLRLFCFPYAGGSASIYAQWPNHLPAQVEVCAIQLPGHDSRYREPLRKRLMPLVEELADALLPAFNKPFAFFGHSMGALIAYELVRHLRREVDLHPVHLFVSAARAPQIPDPKPPLHPLPEKEFIEEVRGLNGIPADALEHKELMALLLSCLRADFELYETYVHQPDIQLSIPVTIFGGLQDKAIDPAHLTAWYEQTFNKWVVHMLNGDHFFLHTSREQLLDVISDALGGNLGRNR